MYLSIITGLVHNTLFMGNKREELFYNGNNKNAQTCIFQIVDKSVDFTLNSVP